MTVTISIILVASAAAPLPSHPLAAAQVSWDEQNSHTYIYIYIYTYIYIYIYINTPPRGRAGLHVLRPEPGGEMDASTRARMPRAPGSRIDYMRNILGWLETRLAQKTLNYLKIA